MTTLKDRIIATPASDICALQAFEAEARASKEVGVWVLWLDAIAMAHAEETAAASAAAAAQVTADAAAQAASAAAAQAAADAALQSSLLKIVEKFSPLMSAVPALLAQAAPVLDAYRASRANGQSVTTAINQATNTNPPVYETLAQRMAKRSNA